MRPFVTAGAGFLLAVLWFDLMFDVQVLHRREPGDAALDSIAAYYARVTTAARPMNRLVAAAMAGTLAAIVAQIVRGEGETWARWASLTLACAAIGLAAAHTVPSAVRLGRRSDPPAVREELARSILRDHLFCISAIASLLAIQLAFGG
jgi:hypothetical protein